MKLDKATVANRYGEAIFEIAEEQGNIVAFSEELEELRQVFLANPQLSDVLVGAQLDLLEKQGLIKVLLKDASPIIANVIQMVFDYGRMGDMVGIIEEFERLCDVKEKVVHATVTTAIKLDDDQLEKLSAKFAERIGANKIVFNNIIDEKIIGGVVIEANNQIFDGSISSKINKVKRLLANQ
ncbi:ATP synthase subunit delta [Dellaglioa algida]|nr:ATP synthase subunit delta [Dellaglioa algida]